MGMQRGAAGLGAALVTVLIPIFVYIFMIFSKKSKPLIKDLAALLVGTIGILLMMNFDQYNLPLLISGGNFYFILAALTYAAVTIIGAYMKNMHVLAFNFYISLFGFIMAFVFSYDKNLLVTENLKRDNLYMAFTPQLYNFTKLYTCSGFNLWFTVSTRCNIRDIDLWYFKIC